MSARPIPFTLKNVETVKRTALSFLKEITEHINEVRPLLPGVLEVKVLAINKIKGDNTVIILQINKERSPFFKDFGTGDLNPANNEKVELYVLKIIHLETERDIEYFKNDVRKYYNLFFEYATVFEHQPNICPRMFYNSKDSLTPEEYNFLQVFQYFRKTSTGEYVLTTKKDVQTIKLNKKMGFYLTEYRGVNLATVLNVDLVKTVDKRSRNQDMVNDINALDMFRPTTYNAIDKFEREYLYYARRLLFRLLELGYVHGDHHRGNILLDEHQLKNGRKVSFLCLIDLEDVVPIRGTKNKYLTHAPANLFEKCIDSDIRASRPRQSLEQIKEDDELYDVLAGKFSIEPETNSKFNTWIYRVKSDTKQSDEENLMVKFARRYSNASDVDVMNERIMLRKRFVMYSWLGWKLDEKFIKNVHKLNERQPTRPKVCSDEEYNTWVNQNVTAYIRDKHPGYNLRNHASSKQIVRSRPFHPFRYRKTRNKLCKKNITERRSN